MSKLFRRWPRIEAEVLAEGREWTRQRLQARLQQLADQHGEVFPKSQRRLIHRHACRFHSDTGAGVVEVRAWHEQDPADGHWAIRCGSGGGWRRISR